MRTRSKTYRYNPALFAVIVPGQSGACVAQVKRVHGTISRVAEGESERDQGEPSNH